jgi:hypothetical protein
MPSSGEPAVPGGLPGEPGGLPGEEPGEEAPVGKAILRRRILAARASMPDSARADAGRRIRDHLLGMPEIAAAGTVAAYYSVGTEPDTRGLVFALWKRGSYVILPVLLPDGDLDWASYEGPDSLVPGPRGLLQPAEPARGARRSWCPRSPWTSPGTGSAAAAVPMTARWPGSARGSP